jgi:hypothetical protein
MEALSRISMEEFEHALDKTIEYYSFDEGKQIQGMISYLNDVATELCDFYDITCCSKQKNKHFNFWYGDNDDPAIATILKGGYLDYGLEQGNQYVAFMGSYEIYSLIIEKPKNSAMGSKVIKTISYLVNFFLENFTDNYYVGQFVNNLYAGNKNH